MDQRGNYWRVFPKGTLAGADEDMLSMCPTSGDNYKSEPVAIYRQGRDLSAKQMQELLARIDHATDDDLLKRAAQNAWEAWTTGRDMVTEAELLIQLIGVRLSVEEARDAD